METNTSIENISYGDIIIVNNKQYTVRGGDRRDHYQHYISMNDKVDVPLNRFNDEDVKIIKKTCYRFCETDEDIYHGDVIQVSKRNKENPKLETATVICSKEYPYYFFKTQDKKVYPMNQFKWHKRLSQNLLLTMYPKGN